ncbi:OprD family outer membrane porin [Thaumasiovibrio subtropicus]|uniref:OprD family outer membrane porin n=1 Tax=Thaumasiovibrio subtropicus TaxID=1891207 RepID=UPI000B356B08|nr:OprD family outer membrane porin [Thaumasiovibrio subtropicus]
MSTTTKTALTLVSLSVAAALASTQVQASTLDQNDVLNQSAAAVDLADEAKQAFYEESSSKIHTFLYIRDREERDPTSNTYVPNIENQTLQLAWDYKSGYFKDTIGLDLWANTNLQLGDTTGMSEILYFDHKCKEVDGKYEACEKSYSALTIAALKAKFGTDNAGLAVRGGYTRINIGTIRSSWGLNPHAYRGIELKGHVGDFILGYAIADRFKNDWRKEFLPMTTKWHQNQTANSSTINTEIDYIHTLGAIYKFDGGQIDLGYGEGKDYRKNWQALAKYGFNVGDARVDLSGFYHGGRSEESELTGLQDTKNEYYLGLGAKIKHGNFTWVTGVSTTDTQGQASAYNFRLTPWANSDNRNFMQTTSQLEDYNVDGTRAFKLTMNYNFAEFGLPGLSAGIGGSYGNNVFSGRDGNGDAKYDGKMHSFDWNVGYKFQEGSLEGLNVRVHRGQFRGDDIVHKKDRNDLKVLISYSVTLK